MNFLIIFSNLALVFVLPNTFAQMLAKGILVCKIVYFTFALFINSDVKTIVLHFCVLYDVKWILQSRIECLIWHSPNFHENLVQKFLPNGYKKRVRLIQFLPNSLYRILGEHVSCIHLNVYPLACAP